MSHSRLMLPKIKKHYVRCCLSCGRYHHIATSDITTYRLRCRKCGKTHIAGGGLKQRAELWGPMPDKEATDMTAVLNKERRQ